ncbi:LysE family translocator [Roseateles violae]|uniref:LysE family translocator n=1 Tax=Roseateles violae TaxID=3058042 RepID=A0ABT8DUZ1_9BURK|nr:LysE family translocator [Pelomonas sp. PFR6]MDN3922104.1 LysE family translocator [Pelomonas sp. PFR6]
MDAGHELWIYFALTFGIIVLPGMDMAFVAGSALTAGLRGGLLALAGIVVGGFVHVIVNVLGLSALLLLWPAAFNVLLLAGCAYMSWIGLAILRAAPSAGPQLKPGEAGQARDAIFLRGVLNCLLNPKAYAFMLAVFPGFLRTPQRGVAEQALLLSAITAGNQIAIYGVVALVAAGAQRWAGPGAAAQRGLSLGVGSILILAAAFTAAAAWRSV